MPKAKISLFRLFLSLALILAMLVPLMPQVRADNMTYSRDLVTFVENQEGFRSEAYGDSGGYSIGYGTSCGQNQYPGGITREFAESLLEDYLTICVIKLNTFAIQYDISFTQCQFDALCSLCYNLGTSWLDTDSTLTRYLKGQEKYTEQGFTSVLSDYCHSGGTMLQALWNRRVDEAAMFLYGDYSATAHTRWRWVVLHLNGGSVTPSCTVFSYLYGQVYGNLPTPTFGDLSFRGWQTASGTAITNNTVVSANQDLYATYGSEALSFSDVRPTDWYYEYVTCLAGQGLVSGYPDKSFGPQNPVTLGETLCLFLKAMGVATMQAGSGQYWSQPYVDYAAGKGCLDGIENLDPQRAVTREEIAHILCNMQRYTAKEASPFADTASVYAAGAAEMGLMVGSTAADGTRTFGPSSTLTRAEMTTVVYKLYLTW